MDSVLEKMIFNCGSVSAVELVEVLWDLRYNKLDKTKSFHLLSDLKNLLASNSKLLPPWPISPPNMLLKVKQECYKFSFNVKTWLLQFAYF